jgi:Flp pilus assembly protein TadD
VQTHYQPWYTEAGVLLGADLVEETKRLNAAGDQAAAAAALQEALAILEEAVPVRKDAGEARTTLAAAYELAGRSAEAEKLYQSIGETGGMTADAHLNLGAVLSRQGRLPEAIEHFRAAARLQPESVEPLIYLGLGLAQAGDRQGASEQFVRAMQLDPAASNQFLTNALRLPPKETNLQEFIAYLQGQGSPSGQ